MAAYITIEQGAPDKYLERQVKKTWTYINTSREDEEYICRDGFLYILLDDKINENEYLLKEYKKVQDRFFTKGLFLASDDVDVLNTCLRYLGRPELKIPNDGKYFQPTEPGKTKPTPKGWKMNGDARLCLYKKVLEEWKEEQMKVATVSLEEFYSE